MEADTGGDDEKGGEEEIGGDKSNLRDADAEAEVAPAFPLGMGIGIEEVGPAAVPAVTTRLDGGGVPSNGAALISAGLYFARSSVIATELSAEIATRRTGRRLFIYYNAVVSVSAPHNSKGYKQKKQITSEGQPWCEYFPERT